MVSAAGSMVSRVRGGHWSEEAPDNVLALGEQRVAEPLRDEWGEVDEVHLGELEVGQQILRDRLVVQQLCDSHVTRGDRRDNTQVVLEERPLRVEVVRFAEVVVVHLACDGSGVVMELNNGIVVQLVKQSMSVPLQLVNVGFVVVEEEVAVVVDWNGSCMRISSKCVTHSVETAVWPAW